VPVKVIINEPSIGLTDQTDRIWYSGQNNFTLIRGQRGTANITFTIADNDPYRSTDGSPIYIHEIVGTTDTIRYAGKILTIDRKWNGSDGRFNDLLSLVSLESCFDIIQIDPPRSFTGKTAGQILISLFNSLCVGVPVTLGTIDVSAGGILPMQVYRKTDRLSDVFTQLATLAGNGVIWSVRMSDQTLQFGASSSEPAPFTLTKFNYETGDLKIDETDYRNRQYIQISFTAFSTDNQVFPGDDISQTLTLPFAVDRVVSAMLTTGSQATAVGIFGTLSPVTSGNPSPGDKFTITPPHSPPVVEDPYTFVAVLDNTLRNQILIGVTAAATCQNTVDAINANPAKAGVTFSLPTWPNDACNADVPFLSPPRFTLRVKNPGSGGNGCILTSTPFALSPFVAPAFIWEGGDPSPFSSAQTLGGTDGTTNALNVGVAGAGTLSTDIQYTPGSNIITCNAAIQGGSSLSVAYCRLGGDTIAVEDSAAVAIRAAAEHGSGRYSQLITDAQNADARSGYIKALQTLLAYRQIPQSFSFTIDEAFAPTFLSPGQLLTILITSPVGAPVMVDGNRTIQEVQATLVPGLETQAEPYGHFRYTVNVINTTQVSTFIDFWENLAILSPVGAQTVSNFSSISATPTLTTPVQGGSGTTPTTTSGTPTTPAGQQWVQEAPGRFALVKATDLVVDASNNAKVTSASHTFIAGDVGKHVIVIAGTGWTPGDYTILSVATGAAVLSSSPAAVGTTTGIWALCQNDLWCTTWVPSNSYVNVPTMILAVNGSHLSPFAPHSVGYIPGGGDYSLPKGNQILFATPLDPSTDKVIATYFPAGIVQAPITPQTTLIAVHLTLLATDFPQSYTPHIPPGGSRSTFDVATPGAQQEVQATISASGTTDLGVIWQMVSTDGHTTTGEIGTLSASPNGPLFMLYTAPSALPSSLGLPDTVTISVKSHADSTVTSSVTVNLTAVTPPPSGNFVAIGFRTTSSQFLMSSPDAITWTTRSSPLDGGNGGKCITTDGAGTIVAIGSDSTNSALIAVRSTDHGLTWVSHAIPQPGSGQYVDMVFAVGLFVAVAEDGTVITSPTGVTWTNTATVTTSGTWKTIAFGAGVFVIIGGAAGVVDIASSPDATTWTAQTAPIDIQLFIMSSLVFASGQFVSLGESNFDSNTSSMDSPDGAAWTSFSTGNSFLSHGVAFGAGLYASANADAFTSRTLTSPDAQTWASHIVTDANDCNRVRFLNALFVACRNDSATSTGKVILTSPDGLAWTTRTGSLPDSVWDVTFG